MKKKEFTDLKTKTIEELTRDVLSLKKEIVELSHDIKMGRSTSTAALRTKRKNVAKILTIIGQMRLNPVSVEKIEKKEKKPKKMEQEDILKAKGENK